MIAGAHRQIHSCTNDSKAPAVVKGELRDGTQMTPGRTIAIMERLTRRAIWSSFCVRPVRPGARLQRKDPWPRKR